MAPAGVGIERSLEVPSDSVGGVAQRRHLRRIALVYPADGEVVPTTHRIRNDDVLVLVRTIPVGTDAAGFVDLDRRAAGAARDLLRELGGALAVRDAA